MNRLEILIHKKEGMPGNTVTRVSIPLEGEALLAVFAHLENSQCPKPFIYKDEDISIFPTGSFEWESENQKNEYKNQYTYHSIEQTAFQPKDICQINGL